MVNAQFNKQRRLNNVKLDYVLNTQEVIERKVKELNEILKQASKNGIETGIEVITDSRGWSNGYEIVANIKVNPKLLEIK